MYAAFDIGGTNMRLGVSESGEDLDRKVRIPTPQNFEEAMVVIAENYRELAQGGEIVQAAGGMPGTMRLPEHDLIIKSPNLPEWSGHNLKEGLEKAIGAPVAIENDTAIVGMGEGEFGAARGHSLFAYVTVSTGVGGCRFVDGKIDKKSLGFEPGWQIIGEHKDGSPAYLEELTGGNSLQAKYGKEPKDIDDPTVWDDVARNLAIGMNNLVCLWSPEAIILGGPMMNDISLEAVKKHLREFAEVFDKLPELKLAELGSDGGLYGALAYAKSLK